MSSHPLVVITGGKGDLAQALATWFGEAGYRVECPGREELDVTRAEAVENYFATREPVSVLINNAGITGDSLLARLSPEQWDAVIDTNLKGAHLCSQAAARRMIRQRDGHIIHIGSYSALQPPVGQCAYAAAKAGLIGLTKSHAKEFGARNIRVNCVLPGFLETRMTASLGEAPRAAALERHALKRFNTREEAARFIHYLTTTAHISGQVFQLDSRA
ncbi:MAG: SDR family NAD(P)-dependent oxidoreductase [Verrucomicrobiaceae bacterium]|nr:SDR family NAD(P)-dependent oxidoreductase [Verrucomicrobiaceae bacterium]